MLDKRAELKYTQSYIIYLILPCLLRRARPCVFLCAALLCRKMPVNLRPHPRAPPGIHLGRRIPPPLEYHLAHNTTIADGGLDQTEQCAACPHLPRSLNPERKRFSGSPSPQSPRFRPTSRVPKRKENFWNSFVCFSLSFLVHWWFSV